MLRQASTCCVPSAQSTVTKYGNKTKTKTDRVIIYFMKTKEKAKLKQDNIEKRKCVDLCGTGNRRRRIRSRQR